MPPRRSRPPPPLLSPSRTTHAHTAPSLAAVLTPDGAFALTTSMDCSAVLHTRTSPSLPPQVLRHDAAVLQCALSSDGRIAATACADGAVRVWEAGQCVYKLEERRVGMGAAYGCALSGDGESLYASFRRVDEEEEDEVDEDCGGVVVVVRCWREAEREERGGGVWKKKRVFWRSAGIFDVFVGRGGGDLCVVEEDDAGGDGMRVVVLDERDGGVRRVFGGLKGSVGAALDSEGNRVAIADGKGLRVFSVETGECVRKCVGYVGAGGADVYLALTGDGARVVANGGMGWGCWDVESGDCVGVMGGVVGDAGGCGISDDGRVVVGCGDDGVVRFWEVPVGAR